jgi:hypothetical protein
MIKELTYRVGMLILYFQHLTVNIPARLRYGRQIAVLSYPGFKRMVEYHREVLDK